MPGKWCRSQLAWSCDGFDCELPDGHEGDHAYTSLDGGSQRHDGRKDHLVFRPTSFEIRWRENKA